MKDKIAKDIVAAMKDKDKIALETLRMVKGAIQLEEIKVKKELNIQLPIIGLVKNEKHSTEYLITEQKKKVLLKNKSIYNFLARIQNEVDSYAKNFHLKKKINSSLEGFLTSISGIGLKTEEKLLKHFHTYANIYNANEDELSKVVSKSVAKKIIEKLEK